MNWIYTIAIVIAAWNALVFLIYGIDKRKAQSEGWRISERTLLLLAAFMGALGAWIGMNVFHHKTKHAKFKIGVPFLLVLNVAVIVISVLTMA